MKKFLEQVACSIVETFGEDVTPRDLDETLRMEYRTKLLNPRWATRWRTRARAARTRFRSA